MIKLIIPNIFEDLKNLRDSSSPEQLKKYQIDIAISLLALLDASAFFFMLALSYFIKLDYFFLILHSVVSSILYFLLGLIKNSEISSKLKIHTVGAFASIEYLITFFLLFEKLGSLYWFTLLFVLIPAAASTLTILFRYILAITAITFVITARMSQMCFDKQKCILLISSQVVFLILVAISYFIYIIFRIILEKEKEKNAKLTELNKKLNKIAYMDSLTGLLNRKGVYKKINELVSLDKSFYIADFDFDKFKKVNETTNHHIGDELLKYVANYLKEAKYQDCIIGRVSSNEFIIVCEKNMSKEAFKEGVEDLLKPFTKNILIEKHMLNINISCGIVEFPYDGKTLTEIFKNGSFALLAAKQSKKNKLVVFDEQLGNINIRKANLENELKFALKNKEFYLMYQPLVNLKSANRYSFEALLRWNSQKLGFISPNEFISICESTGLIHDIGLWVINEACIKVVELIKNLNCDIHMSVNVSPIQLNDVKFYDNVVKIIERVGIEPKMLCFEFTESAFINNGGIVHEQVYKFRKYGIDIAIDDFGVGYSNFNYLPNLPANILKIDKSFIDKITESDKYNKIVDSIIAMGHSLDMSLVAEGIETKKQRDILMGMNCDYIQGYFYSKPLLSDEVLSYIKAANNY